MNVDVCRYERGGILKRCSECRCVQIWKGRYLKKCSECWCVCRYERGGILKRCNECWCVCRWDSWALLALPPLSTSPFRAMLCMAQGGTRTTSTKSRWVPLSSGSDSAKALTSGFKSRLVPYTCSARTIRPAKGLDWAHQQGPLYRFTKNQRSCDCSCFPAKVSGLVCVFNGHARAWVWSDSNCILFSFGGTNNCSFLPARHILLLIHWSSIQENTIVKIFCCTLPAGLPKLRHSNT